MHREQTHLVSHLNTGDLSGFGVLTLVVGEAPVLLDLTTQVLHLQLCINVFYTSNNLRSIYTNSIYISFVKTTICVKKENIV